MKKMYAFYGVIIFIFIFIFSTGIFAQIDNLTNMSAEWIRMSNRNAATDATDIVVYNPAGLTKLADGFHLNLSNQTLVRKPEHTFDLGIGLGKESYTQDSIDAFLPNFYAAYKKDNWAIFGGVYIPGGGAVVDYPRGSLTTKLIGLSLLPLFPGVYDYFKDDFLEASSLYLTTTFGAAYALYDTISVAAGVRYIMAKNTIKAGITLTNFSGLAPDAPLSIDSEDRANGLGVVCGINISPTPELNIGIHYETRVKLEFETEVLQDSFDGAIVVDGEKHRRDFPAMLGVGISYNFTPELRGEVDFNYFFQEQADWGTIRIGTEEDEISYFAGDCYSFGAALAYQVTPKLQLSAGGLYTKFDFKEINCYYANLGAFEVLYSNNLNLGAGFSYKVCDRLKVNLGVSYTIWKDETIKALAAFPLYFDVDTNNTSYAFALGLDFSL